MRETTKESQFKRKFKPEKVTQDTSSLVIEDSSRPVGPYARTAVADIPGLEGLFNNDDEIFIFKQFIGQSEKFMYLLADEKPENYERPQNFEGGDFQVINLATEEQIDSIHKQFKISLCSYEDNYQFRKHGECGKRWELSKYYYVYGEPKPDTHLVYVGSRDTKPWDTRLSLNPLDGTPFVKNQFTMYVKVKMNADISTESSEKYDTVYHYTGWTSRYTAQNLTIHSYSKSNQAPDNFRQAEYGARSVPGFRVPFAGQSQGVKSVLMCEKKENKKPKNIFGKGMTVQKRTVLSEKCSKDYYEVDRFEVWQTQADAPSEAVNIFVTKKKSWPFDTLVTFTHLGKNDDFKPAFSFWAIPLNDPSLGGFVRSSGLVVSGIRSDRMTIEWRKDPFIKSYNVTVVPQPAKMQKFEIMKANRLRLKGLDAGTEYTVSVTPTTSSGIELEEMRTRQSTAPSPKAIRLPLVRSTSFQIDIPQIEGAEDYRIKIEPEVRALPSNSSYLTVECHPNTQYSVSVITIMSKAKDIQTSEITRTLRSAPSPHNIDLDLRIDGERSGLNLNVNGMEKEARGYRFIIDGDEKESIGRSDGIHSTNQVKVEHLKQNDIVKVQVAISLQSNNDDEKRETDFVTVETPFKTCGWVESEKKLACSGRSAKEKAQILSWTVTADNSVLVRSQSGNQTTIDPREVETINIDGNKIGGTELKKFISTFPNLQRLNVADNTIETLSADTFRNNRNLWKLNLNNNLIEEFPTGIFDNTPDLQILDVSFNPLEYCGLGHSQLNILETKLRQLDLRGTHFPENLVGHWNALMLYYDVGDDPEFIHQAIYPKLCPIQT